MLKLSVLVIVGLCIGVFYFAFANKFDLVTEGGSLWVFNWHDKKASI